MSRGSWPTLPFAVQKIAAEAGTCRVSFVASWDRLMRSVSMTDPKDEAERMAADKIAHEFAGEVLRNGSMLWSDELEGMTLDLRCHALTHNELLALLNRAYLAGFADGHRSAPSVTSPF